MSLLQVTINDTVLDPPKSSEMAFEFLSSAINDEFIAGSGSFDITFPDTPNNRKAFEYANRLDALGGLRKYNCKVEDKADALFVGELILWNIQNGFNTTIEQTSVRSAIEGVKIADLNFDDIDIGPDTQDVIDYADSTKNGGDYPVYFPVMHAPDFYGDNHPDWPDKTINNYDPVTETYYNNFNPGPDGIDYPLLPVVPFYWILKQIALDYDLSLQGNGLDMVELKQAYFQNNYSLDKYGDSYLEHKEFATVVATVENLLLGTAYTGKAIGVHRLNFDGKIESYSIGKSVEVGIAKWNSGGGTWDFVSSTVMATGADFHFALDYDVTSTSDQFQVKIIATGGSTTPVSLEDVVFDFFAYDNQFSNVHVKIIHIANHLPDMLVTTFLANIKSIFGLKVDFNDKLGTLKLTKRVGLLSSVPIEVEPLNIEDVKIEFQDNNGFDYKWEDGKDPFEFDGDDLGEFDDVSDLPTPEDVKQYAFVLRTNAWYKVQYDEDTDLFSWQYQQYDVSNVVVGDGEISDVSLVGSPVPMTVNPNGLYVPLFIGEAWSPLFSKFDKNTDIYIGIYRGLGQNPVNTYPFGNSTPHTRQNFDYYDFGLLITRNNNLFDELHRLWYETKLNSDTITFDIDGRALHVSELFNNRLYWDGIMMLLEELTLSYSDKKQTKGQVKALKINY